MEQEKLKQAVVKAGKALYKALPVLLGAVLLVSLASALIPKNFYYLLFSGNPLVDPLIGGVVGSILAGNPITSYVIGGELLAQGVSLLAVTAFLVAWVTVGIIQLPAESILLGKRFAVTRNITAFVFAIISAVITVALVSLI
ncbi:permease [Candidatus Woesearchaeota archaeon]|nr:permease [Candidatus Woesearchaeota archaeon]